MKEKAIKIIGKWQLWEVITLSILLAIVMTLCGVFHCSVFIFISTFLGLVTIFVCAKGILIYPILQICNSAFYAYVAYNSHYFGEAIIYIGLMVPLAIFSLITWSKNQNTSLATVSINQLRRKEWLCIVAASACVAVGFYFLLAAFNTPNLWLSTAAVVFCVIAIYINLRRSKIQFFFFCMTNLIVLSMWVLLLIQNYDMTVLPIAVCNGIYFFINIFGYYNWTKMEKTQATRVDK